MRVLGPFDLLKIQYEQNLGVTDEECFRSLVESAPVGIFFNDAEGQCVYTNPRWREMVGICYEEALGHGWRDAIAPEDRESVFTEWRQCVEQGRKFSREFRFRRPNGEVRWVHGRAIPIRSADGVVQGYVGTNEDITERKQLELGLRAQLRLATLHAKIGVALNSGNSLCSILQECAALLVEHLDVAFSRIWTLNETEQTLELQASAGLSTHINEPHGRIPIGQLTIGLIAQERRPHLTNDILQDLDATDKEWARREGMVSFAGYPLVVEDRLVGVIAAFARQALPPATLVELGSIAGLVAQCVQRKHMEEALRHSEERWRGAQHLSLDGFAILRSVRNEGGEIVDFIWEDLNISAAILLGRRQSDVIGRRLLETLPGVELQSEAFGNLVAVAETGASYSQEVHSEADGARGWFRLGIVRLGDGVAVSCSDISERKQMEAALRDSERHFHAILDSVIDIVSIVDADGATRYISPSVQRVLGYEPEERLGRNSLELVHADDIADVHAALARVVHHPDRIELFRYRLLHQDGSWRVLEAVAKGLLDDPILAGILISSRDITEQRHLETQLLLARKMESIGQLAAGIAHEINTPMQYIGDNTHFLQDAFQDLKVVVERYEQLLAASKAGAVTPDLLSMVETAVAQADLEYLREEIPSAIEQALQGVERVTKIVRAMKEFSHPDHEKKVATDVNRAIETTVTVARNEWKYVAEVMTDFDLSLPLVPCFSGEFNQVILNLLVNAAHAIADAKDKGSAGKGTITISTRGDGDWVEIRLSDTGTGIPETIRTKIYDPFFTTKQVGKGTGQGLAIAHAIIVKQHGGAIDCESEVGRGTTFRIRLPLLPAPSFQEEAHETTHSLC